MQTQLPIVRCTSLHDLANMVKDVQLAEASGTSQLSQTPLVVLDPVGAGSNVRLSDLIEVKLDSSNDVFAVIAKRPFHWERWTVNEGPDAAGILEFPFTIRLPHVEVGVVDHLSGTDIRPHFTRDLDLSYTCFLGPTDFSRATFSGRVKFLKAQFTEGVKFESATFHSNLYLHRITLRPGASPVRFINLFNTTIHDKVVFGLDNRDRASYEAITLGLHNSNIAYFSCDQQELEAVTLYWESPLSGIDKAKRREIVLQRRLHELRVMRRIMGTLGWGDAADNYYRKMREAQYSLRTRLIDISGASRPVKLIRKMGVIAQGILFRRLFGWGVRIRNVVYTILGTVAVCAAIFALTGPRTVDGKILSIAQLARQGVNYSVRYFLTLDVDTLPALPWYASLIGYLEAAIGITLFSVFIAMVARKFMRF